MSMSGTLTEMKNTIMVRMVLEQAVYVSLMVLYIISTVIHGCRTGYAFEADGKAYISDKQGVSHEIEGDNKWVQYDGTYYYLKDGHFLKECVEKIDGNYFGFDSAGQMYNNRSFSVSFQDEIGSWWTGYYRAKSGGFCIPTPGINRKMNGMHRITTMEAMELPTQE